MGPQTTDVGGVGLANGPWDIASGRRSFPVRDLRTTPQTQAHTLRCRIACNPASGAERGTRGRGNAGTRGAGRDGGRRSASSRSRNPGMNVSRQRRQPHVPPLHPRVPLPPAPCDRPRWSRVWRQHILRRRFADLIRVQARPAHRQPLVRRRAPADWRHERREQHRDSARATDVVTKGLRRRTRTRGRRARREHDTPPPRAGVPVNDADAASPKEDAKGNVHFAKWKNEDAKWTSGEAK